MATRPVTTVKWAVTEGYSCSSSAESNAAAFADMEFEDGEWNDYDGENELALFISGVEHKFEVHKEKKGGKKGKKK